MKNKSSISFPVAPRRNEQEPNKFFSATKNNTLSYAKGLSQKPFGANQLGLPGTSNSLNLPNSNRPSNTSKPVGKKRENAITNILSPSNIQEEEEGANLRDDLTKQVPKRKFLLNCDFQKALFELPKNALFSVLTFLIDDYRSLILVSPLWYFKVNESLDEYLMVLDNQFIKNHMKILTFHRSFSSFHPFKFGKKTGFRLDRNFVAEPLHSLVGKSNWRDPN